MTAAILTALIAMNLAAAGAIAVLLVVSRPLRRVFGARIAYAAWAVVPLAALASLLPARPMDALPSAPLRPFAQATVILLSEPMKAAPVDWTAVTLAAWALGALFLLVLTAWTQRRTLGLIGRLTPEGRLVRSANPAVGPATLGVFRPRIMVPADFELRFDADERAVIIAHEEAHLAGGDVRINALIELIRCLFWFNPLIHLAARQVRVEQELACDAAVIARFPGRRRTYAAALLKTQTGAAALPLGCYWPSHPLKERLTMLTLKSPGRARSRCGGAAVALLSLTTGYAAWTAAPAAATPAAILEPILTPVAASRAAPGSVHGAAPARRLQQPAPTLTNSAQSAEPEPAPDTKDRTLRTFQLRKVGPVTFTADQTTVSDRVLILRGENASVTATAGDGSPASLTEIAKATDTIIIRCDKSSDGPAVCTDSEGRPADPINLGGLVVMRPDAPRRIVIMRHVERGPTPE